MSDKDLDERRTCKHCGRTITPLFKPGSSSNRTIGWTHAAISDAELDRREGFHKATK